MRHALTCGPLLILLLSGSGASVHAQDADFRLRPLAQRDTLILRSGGREEGNLSECSLEACTLQGKPYPRSDIVLIGLRVALNDPPPQIEDPLQDLIQLRKAAPLKTKLLTIDARSVASESGVNRRQDVAWIYLAPDAAGRGSAKRGDSLYYWQGQVDVENSFEGRTLAMDVHGRHKWQGRYFVKFLEQWTDEAVSGANAQLTYLNQVVPLELEYTVQADHHHDYDHRWGDTILRGTARGTIAEPQIKDSLTGDVRRFEKAAVAQATPGADQPRSFASWQEFREFVSRFETEQRPGCYHLSIQFRGTPAELRARYRGIQRSGSSPIHPNPDEDFLRVMPAFMPDGTNIYGCLDRPQQAAAEGSYTFPFPDPGPLDSTEQITIRWSFTRVPCSGGRSCPQAPASARR